MPRVTRRAFAAGLATLAAPFVIRPAAAADFDVIVIGAGAAGIAAARRLTQANKRVAVLEAGERVGGRCFTDQRIFGSAYELGAQWLHETPKFPLAKLATDAGLTIDKRAPNSQLRIPIQRVRGRGSNFRAARESESEEFYGNLVRSTRAIAEAADVGINCSEALPVDLGDWRETMEFLLGPFVCGADLAAMAPREYASYDRPDHSLRLREGAGTLMRWLALGLPIQYFSPATRIAYGSQGVEVETPRARFSAATAILTAPTGVLAANKIVFQPALPARVADAIQKLKPGAVERVAVQLDSAALPSDQLYIEKAEHRRTAAAHINAFGSGISFVQVGGRTCRDLVASGEPAMTAFAHEWLSNHFGTEITRLIKRTHVSRWHAEPWTLGAFSYAAPQTGAARKALTLPLGDRVWFAGEAVHDSLWGTVAGAWETGERAADAVIARKAG